MLSGQGTLGRGLRPEMVPPGARPAQGHKIRNAERFIPFSLREGMDKSSSATDQRSVMLISKGGVFRSILKGVKTG